MNDPFSPYSPADARAASAGTRPAAPPVGFVDSVKAGFNYARAAPDWGLNQWSYEGHVLQDIEAEARKRGFVSQPRAHSEAEARQYAMTHTLTEGDDDRVNELLGWFAGAQATDPKLLPQYAGLNNREALRQYALGQRRIDMQKAGGQLQNGSTVGSLIGQVGAGFLDPTNYIPVGGQAARAASVGRVILGTALREGAANIAVTAAREPFTRTDAEALGVPRTLGDFKDDLIGAGLTGAAIGGGVSALGHGGAAMVGAFKSTVPRDVRTPTEQAAINVLDRHDEVQASSPYVRTPAGDDAHAATLDAILKEAPPPRDTRGTTVPRSAVLSGAADLGSLREPAFEQVKAHIRHAESGGNDQAVNPNSTASGRYQFTMPTWLSYYKRRYGGAEGTQAIWGKRLDVSVQEVLMGDLLKDNAATLRAHGHEVTAGNLYLLHFAGPDGLKVLRAAGETPLEQLLPARDFAKNAFLRGKTAADLRAWADRKMGGPGRMIEGHAGEAPASAERGLPQEPAFDPADFEARPEGLAEHDRPSLRTDLYATAEEHAAHQVALWREQDAREGFATVADDPAFTSAGAPVVEASGPAPMRRSGPTDVMQEVADAGGLRDSEGHALAEGRNIPAFIKGAGVILRKDGDVRARTVDAMGEHLWEQGFFGPPSTTPRPSEAQVLELVERGAREKMYRPEDVAKVAERRAQRAAPSEEEAADELRGVAADSGLGLDHRTLQDALMHRAAGESPESAVARAVHEAAYRDAAPPVGLERFDDPDGEAIRQQIESAEHDLRMALAGGDEGAYRVGDEGEALSLAEMFERLDADDQANAALRGCMAPMKEAAE